VIASLFTFVLVMLAAPPARLPFPTGWEQIDTESYHGPEGWYHDSSSGAIVRYWTGPIPDYIGIRPDHGVSCAVTQPPATSPIPCLLSMTGRELQVFVGPYGDGVYASYRATIESPHQERRVKNLALSNPLAIRLYSGHKMLPRDARESDLRAVVVGMTLDQVLELLGDPLTIEPATEGGFAAEFVVWDRWPGPGGKLTWASRTVRLEFSRSRLLLTRPPYRKRVQASSRDAGAVQQGHEAVKTRVSCRSLADPAWHH
jgi:hypothetical protein